VPKFGQRRVHAKIWFLFLMHADLVIFNIGQLITCSAGKKPKRGAEMLDIGLVEDAAIAVVDGHFAAVSGSDEIEREWTADATIDADGKVVCPGFVDPHTHIVYAGDRLNEFELKIKGADYLEILAAGGGILSTVEKTRQASCEELIESGLRRLDKMFACGTTTAEIKTGYGLDTDTELKMLRVIEELDKLQPIEIIPTFLAAHAVPPEYKNDVEGYVSLVCVEMLPRAWDWYEQSHFNRQTPFFIDVFCERNAFTLNQSKRILEAAIEIGFRVKAHVDEFLNLGGSRMSVALGATSIDHLDVISDDEIKLLAASETVGIITPAVNFNFGSPHFADARKLIDEGCAVALATDYNPGSAPCPSQPMAMAIACRYQRLLPAEALNAATINAAFAIGLGDQVGSIEVGKSADLVLLDTYDHRETVYEFGSSLVKVLVKKGRIQINN
jgi:imidazolonepropionase